MENIPLPHAPSPGPATDAERHPTARSSRFIEHHLPRNFVVLFIHGMLGQTGFRLLSAPTFLPAYISLLTGTDAAAGLARAVQSLGMFISPVLSARMVEHRRRVLRMAFACGMSMRVQILLLALAALFLPRELALFAVWPVIGVWGLMSGMQMVVFNFLLSKAIPVDRRGRLHGLRNLTSALTLLVVSAAAGWMVDRYGFPGGYGRAFLLSFVLTTSGLLAILFLVEPSSTDVRAAVPLTSRLSELPALLRNEPHFARFVQARLFAAAARGALPFYILSLGQRLELTGALIGTLTISFTLAQGVMAMVWGFLADKRGFRLVFLLSLFAWLAANLLILVEPGLGLSFVIFWLVGAGFSGFHLSGSNLVLEFGSERERAMRIATMHSLSEATGAIGFFLAAALAATAPLVTIFIASATLQVLAALLLGRMKEPRHHLPG